MGKHEHIMGIKMMMDWYSENYNYLVEALYHIRLRPVIYDEVEFFSNDNSYPFKPRKTTLAALASVSLAPIDSGSPMGDRSLIFNNAFTHAVQLKRNLVCLDNLPYSDLMFWADDKCDFQETSQYDFSKLKFSKSDLESQNFILI